MNNWIDSCLLGVLFISIVFGFWRGLFASVFGILNLVLAIFAGIYGGQLLLPSMRGFWGDSPAAPLIAGALAFLIVFLLAGLFFKVFAMFLAKSDISGLNRVGGVLFGLLRGALLVLVIVLVLSAVAVPKTKTWQTSQVVPIAGIFIKQLLYTAPFVDYKDWVRFDKYYRPLLVDGGGGKDSQTKTGEKQVLSGEEMMAETLSSIQTRRNKELQEVLDIDADYTALKTPYAPDKDEIYRADADSIGSIMREIMCALSERKTCAHLASEQENTPDDAATAQ